MVLGNRKAADELYEAYQAQLRSQELKQDEITEALRKLEKDEMRMEYTRQEIMWVFRELPNQWSGKQSYDEVDLFEDDFQRCYQQVMNGLDEKREELQSRRRILYEEEEEYQLEYQRHQMRLQREED